MSDERPIIGYTRKGTPVHPIAGGGGGTRFMSGLDADVSAGATVGPASGEPATSGFGPGTTARRALIIWGVSAVWLVLVWRAVEGY